MQLLRSVERFELEIEMDRFHLFDRHAFRFFVDRESVDAARDGDVPVLALRAMHDVHFGAVVRVFVCALFGAPGVDVLAEPHTAESVAALDADAPIGRFVDEVSDGADDGARFAVDAH